MEQKNEPTTGEIVRALRYCADVNSICGDACPAHIDEAGCRTVLMQNAADRLESQERTIAELHEQIAEKNDEIQMARDGIDDTVKILTARAESAEETMKAILEVIYSGSVICSICSNRVGWDTCKQCEFKRNRPQHQDKK